MTRKETTEIDELRDKMEASDDADEKLMIADQMAAKRAAMEKSNVVPLFPGNNLPAFPLEIFRDESTAEMVSTIAEATENPVDPVAFVVFNMIGATIGPYVRIQRNEGYVSWCCDYAYLTGGSAVGKSPIFGLAEEAPHEVERVLREEAMERVRDARAVVARLEEDQKLLRRKYKGADKDGFEAAMRDLNDSLEQAKSITLPQLILHDCSPESMILVQAQNDGTATMVSAELPVLSRLLGRSSGKPPDIDALLSSYDGEFYRVDRITRSQNEVDAARLNILGGTQMSVIEELANRPELWDRGLVSRFWFCVSPEPTENDLVDEPVSVSDDLLAPYRDRLVELGLFFRRHLVEPYVPSPDAAELYEAWRNKFKRTHRLQGSKLHHITPFCRKLENKVLRWATLLHVFVDHKESEVSAQAMTDAIKLSEFALGHFQHIYALVHGSHTSHLERALRTHLARKRGEEVKLRDIKNGLPSFAKATVELRDEAIDNLVEDGFLKRKEVRRKEGGRPSLRVVVL
jgi:hypothetical protein